MDDAFPSFGEFAILNLAKNSNITLEITKRTKRQKINSVILLDRIY